MTHLMSEHLRRLRCDDLLDKVDEEAIHTAADELDRLSAIVSRLPATADGVPVVPGMTLWQAFDYGDGNRSEPFELPPITGFATHDGEISALYWAKGFCTAIGTFYSTAQAAKGASQ